MGDRRKRPSRGPEDRGDVMDNCRQNIDEDDEEWFSDVGLDDPPEEDEEEATSPLRPWPSGNVRVLERVLAGDPPNTERPRAPPPAPIPADNTVGSVFGKAPTRRGKRRKRSGGSGRRPPADPGGTEQNEERSGRSPSPVLPTTLAAKYCHYETSGGLLLAYRRGQVHPVGRRGGERGTWMWEVRELDRFLRAHPPKGKGP